jgi:hypothetical protein
LVVVGGWWCVVCDGGRVGGSVGRKGIGRKLGRDI